MNITNKAGKKDLTSLITENGYLKSIDTDSFEKNKIKTLPKEGLHDPMLYWKIQYRFEERYER